MADEADRGDWVSYHHFQELGGVRMVVKLSKYSNTMIIANKIIRIHHLLNKTRLW